jgi:hypothetical protein
MAESSTLTTGDLTSESDDLKGKGNKALETGDFELAVKLYTEAIGLSPTNHALFRYHTLLLCSLLIRLAIEVLLTTS